MLKALMRKQTETFVTAVNSRGKKIEQVERNIVANEKRAEERFNKVEKRMENNEEATKKHMDKLEERLMRLDDEASRARAHSGASSSTAGVATGERVPVHVILGG